MDSIKRQWIIDYLVANLSTTEPHYPLKTSLGYIRDNYEIKRFIEAAFNCKIDIMLKYEVIVIINNNK